MDGDGIPLTFVITKGNESKQEILQPIENRKLNNIQYRAFITTQSIKKLKKYLKEWALEKTGWHLSREN